VDPPGKPERKAGDEQEGEEGDELPPVKAKEAVETPHAKALSKQTKAPPRYSESSLLGAMETAGKKIEDEELRLAMRDSGLGTPATRASIIETLLRREYVRREGKSVVATPKGVALIRMLPSPVLKSAELTGQWEQKLARMARREYEFETFLEEVKQLVRDLVAQINNAVIERAAAAAAGANGDGGQTTPRAVARPEGALDCPKCRLENREGFLLERISAGGKFLVCSTGRDACGFLTDAPKNAKQRKAMQETKCHACGGAMRLRLPKEKGRKTSLSCAAYPKCAGVRWFDEQGALEAARAVAAVETGPECQVCGTPTTKRGPASSGNYFWSCPRWRSDGSGCNSKPVWINERQ
ncbi:MAG: DNA topoisomerase, partial [Pyrinomonadaceae bacterium]